MCQNAFHLMETATIENNSHILTRATLIDVFKILEKNKPTSYILTRLVEYSYIFIRHCTLECTREDAQHESNMVKYKRASSWANLDLQHSFQWESICISYEINVPLERSKTKISSILYGVLFFLYFSSLTKSTWSCTWHHLWNDVRLNLFVTEKFTPRAVIPSDS